RDIHSLVIRSVCHAHGGVYKSVISNKIGKATCYSHLYVTDVLPDPPEGAPQVEAITGKTVTLSWRKPRRLDPSIVSPFAGENDRSSVLNIRNYNVAFEENMFSEAKEAKGFIIKLLVADRLRPDTQECLRHPWFKTLSKGKAVSTDSLKKFVSRRKWQRSLISYKSKMVMRSIPELLNDSTSHISIAVPRNLKEGSPLPSSSSDSDEDIDELPLIPMPLHMEFSGSRMSLNDIQGNEQEKGKQNGSTDWSSGPAQEQPMELDPGIAEKENKGHLCKRSKQENDKSSSEDEPLAELPQRSELSRRPLRRGSSMESDKLEGPGRRRGELRRGGSADSALLLRITPEEGQAGDTPPGDGRRVLKKAVSMELPRRSASPANMSQEDYALKLELMRQRLLRGGSAEKKLSGLRGPLFETLETSDGLSRAPRLGPPPLIRATSSECAPREDASQPKLLRKSASFSQGDSEPIPLHRRSGAPLEIPLAQVEQRKLKEAISMSSLTEQVKFDSRPVTPRPQTPESVVQESPTTMESEESLIERDAKPDEKMDGLTTDSNFDERSSTSGFSERDMSISEEQMMDTEYTSQRDSTPPPPMAQSSMIEEKMEEEEEEEEEAKILEEVEKKTVSVPEEKDKGNEEMEEEKENKVNMPAPRRLEEKSKSVLDLREAQKDQGFMRRLSMRLRRTPSAERKEETAKEEEQAASRRRMSWTLGRKGSQEKKEVEMSRMDGGAKDVQPGEDDKEVTKPNESPVLAMRRKIESTVAGISTKIRSFSEERKVSDEKEQKRTPIFSMLRRATSENRSVKSVAVPSNQLAAQTSNGASSESLDSMSSLKSEMSKGGEVERRSRWDRWGLTRGKRDKTVSQPDIPSAIATDSSGLRSRQYSKLASERMS
ncbi:hypothetical protein CRUP_011540, partial [Coryphaenoides rupestris]